MMTPINRSPTRQRSHSYLSTWHRLVLGGYSVLFALVLPLICWGAAAEPDHPHRFPHFVFAEPLLNPAHLTPLPDHVAPDEMHMAAAHQRNDHDAAAPGEPALATCSLRTTGVIAGRATPTLMVFSILLLVFLGKWTARRADGLHTLLWRYLQWPESLFLPVPLPPPRALLSATY